MSLLDDIKKTRDEALDAIKQAADPQALEAARIRYLGAKGTMKSLMKRMGEVLNEQKREVGQALNETQNALKEALEKAKASAGAPSKKKAGPVLDVTEPLPNERRPELGKRHPLSRTTETFRDLLRALGFELAEGPEVEDERHNFDDLNIPPDHPARDGFDTFFLKDSDWLLRSQTSTVQVRMMETRKPPLRIIAPGRVYRPDQIDATHGSTFHQIEGLYVDKNVSMADLKGTLQLFMEGLMGAGTRIRIRPSFFPFTEPSAEIDALIQVGGDLRWVEMGGCGMVDPAVFRAVNKARGDQAYDPEVWSGFAFGFGIERLAMGRHDIQDMRLFLENDLRFLRQI